jgi:glucosamine--fructose-6-phosphate aminotransferase (isomerizing)
MLREIHEQPTALATTLHHYIQNHTFNPTTTTPILHWLSKIEAPLVIAASGSSRHAALIAELMIEDLSGLAVDVEYASEFIYRSGNAWPNSALMVVSQSGETADTLAALRKANAAGHHTLAITNVPASSMDREATLAFPTLAGRERAIPATKSFTTQLLNLYLLALMSGQARNTLDPTPHLAELSHLPTQIASQLPAWDAAIQTIAHLYQNTTSFLFLGRDLHFPIAREGALKLKESAYLSAEGYPSGELKHGPNALVSAGALLVMLATHDPSNPNSIARYEKVLQLMRDMRHQGANILALANTNDTTVAALANHTLSIAPATEPLLAIAEAIPLQLFAYHMAILHGIDVDHPRNLTKAVLTE